MLFTPSYGGEPIFGLAVSMQMVSNPTANQVTEFFGVIGTFNLWGGSRGRMFLVEGTLLGQGFDVFQGMASLNAAEAGFHALADGIGRDLIDTRGQLWSTVVFDDVFQPDPRGPRPVMGLYNLDGSNAWGLRYKAAFRGLT